MKLIVSALILFLFQTILIRGFKLTVLHTNDIHAGFDMKNSLGSTCTLQDKANNECFGGAARRSTVIQQLRQRYENTLLLDGGDQFQGSAWYSLLRWEPVATVMNSMGYDAMTLGNHEFDDGVNGLTSFLRNLSFPVVVSNLDGDGTRMQGLYQKSLVLEVGGERIGIVGCVPANTPDTSNPGREQKFRDEITSLQAAVDELVALGVNKIIAVTHCGYWKDQEICQKVKHLDLIVGGHSHTFLYTGQPPSVEAPAGPYPTVMKNNGAPCLVVQAYVYGKYLGFIQVDFNDDGKVVSWNGNPILLDNKYEEDPTLNAQLQPYRDRLSFSEGKVMGETATALDGRSQICQMQECNLGNVIADAAVAFFRRKPVPGQYVDKNSWVNVAISLINGGNVRDFQATPWSNLTLTDLYTIYPFGNTLDLIYLQGKYILKAFEHSVADYTILNPAGKFLQISGMQVVYNLSKPNGQRVVSLQALCTNCSIPEYQPVNPDLIYPLVTTSYIINGGNAYRMISKNILKQSNALMLDMDVLIKYLSTNSPLHTGLEKRVVFTPYPAYLDYCSSKNKNCSIATNSPSNRKRKKNSKT